MKFVAKRKAPVWNRSKSRTEPRWVVYDTEESRTVSVSTGPGAEKQAESRAAELNSLYGEKL